MDAAAARSADAINSESFINKDSSATFCNVQDFFDFPSAYASLCCCREATRLLQDVTLYELSARRASLIRQIPTYISFPLRLAEEVYDIMRELQRDDVPEVPSEILEEAEKVKDACAMPELKGHHPQSRCCELNAMQMAKLTFFFVAGLRAYEAKNMEASEKFLDVALAMAPEDDTLIARLADTRFAQYQAVVSANREGDHAHWKTRTLELYQKAMQINPMSSSASNGLSLFQETNDAQKMFLLQAVALDAGNSYALVNLAMLLLDSKEHRDSTEHQCLALLRRALAINPNLFYARMSLAHLLLRLQRYEEAIPVLGEHLARVPDDVDAGKLHDALQRAFQRAGIR
jgi:tetratricopeptide (TPR) repeat protein